ncbi:MAG: hypothetical protein RMZ69_01050 [Nostoc sp. ChiQUE01a]|nr:hypothetical protein [Nostoc sp. ChiQUE01a]
MTKPRKKQGNPDFRHRVSCPWLKLFVNGIDATPQGRLTSRHLLSLDTNGKMPTPQEIHFFENAN